MSTFTKLETFVAVVEAHSFNRAAEKLGTSPAEVSRRISALEADLKTKLIHRTTRKLTITSLGEAYYADCKKILEEMSAANRRILSQQEEPSGTLTILYYYSDDIIHLLPVFTKRYPKIMLKLIKQEQLPDFKQQGIDIAIGLSEDAPIAENCVRKKIDKIRYVICASPDYLANYRPIKKPADLSGHCYISHTGRYREKLIFNNNEEISLPASLLMNDSEEMVKAAVEGLGLIWVHGYRVKKHIENSKLVEVLPKYALPEMNRYIVYRYDEYIDIKIRVFLEMFS
jgi:DNA-binding transcriptional LysR family regulator